LLALGLCQLAAQGPQFAARAQEAEQIEQLNAPLKIAAKPARVLHFPKDTLGEIRIGPNPYDYRHAKGVLAGAARGDVKVEANKVVVFTPSHRFYQNPTVIKTFSPDAFDGLRIAASSLDDSEDQLCSQAMTHIGHLKGLAWLNLDRSDANDADVAHAADIPDLQNLSAFSTTVHGSFLKQLSKLKKLNTLHLSYNSLKDANLVHLAALPSLTYLYLGRAGLSDRAMPLIARCSNLQVLDISQNTIGDAAIPHILALKKLVLLSCRGTGLTTQGLLKLKGSHLQVIILPVTRYRTADLLALRKALPGVKLVCHSENSSDAEAKQLYAPLH